MGKGKILYWIEGRYNNHCNNRIDLPFLRDIFKSYLSYLIKPNYLGLDDNKFQKDNFHRRKIRLTYFIQ